MQGLSTPDHSLAQADVPSPTRLSDLAAAAGGTSFGNSFIRMAAGAESSTCFYRQAQHTLC